MTNREPKDKRSTRRKQARKVLFKTGRPFECAYIDPDTGVKCGWKPDPNKPTDRSNNLDGNHRNKNLDDLDPANLEWLCRIHHRKEDRATVKGVAKTEHGEKHYGPGFFQR